MWSINICWATDIDCYATDWPLTCYSQHAGGRWCPHIALHPLVSCPLEHLFASMLPCQGELDIMICCLLICTFSLFRTPGITLKGPWNLSYFHAGSERPIKWFLYYCKLYKIILMGLSTPSWKYYQLSWIEVCFCHGRVPVVHLYCTLFVIKKNIGC